jgi:3-oxoacyl-[acyl-carrier protein] reductase
MINLKVALITGTRKGIGRYLAEYYLKNGYFVIGCSRSASDLVDDNYLHFILDVKDESSIKMAIKEIRNKIGKIDILINNAGIASMNHVLLTPLKTVQEIFETNFLGTFLFSREVAKLMNKNKFGRIINFTSVAVPLNLEGEAIYAASKSAVEELTRVMSKEVAEMGITVNCIGPTPIETDLIKTVPSDKIQKLFNSQAIKKYGTFLDIINVIDFFIKEESEFITGQVIYLGGVSR